MEYRAAGSKQDLRIYLPTPAPDWQDGWELASDTVQWIYSLGEKFLLANHSGKITSANRDRKKPNKKTPARNMISAGNTLTDRSYHCKQKHSLQYQNTVASCSLWCLPTSSCKVLTLLLLCSAMWHEALYKADTPCTSYWVPASSSNQSLEIFLYLLPQEDSSLQWLPRRCLWFF